MSDIGEKGDMGATGAPPPLSLSIKKPSGTADVARPILAGLPSLRLPPTALNFSAVPLTSDTRVQEVARAPLGLKLSKPPEESARPPGLSLSKPPEKSARPFGLSLSGSTSRSPDTTRSASTVSLGSPVDKKISDQLLALEHGSVTPDEMQEELTAIYAKSQEDFGPSTLQTAHDTGLPRSYFLERRGDKTFATIIYNRVTHGDKLPFGGEKLGAYKGFKWGTRFDLSTGEATRVLVSSQRLGIDVMDESRILNKLYESGPVIQLHASARKPSSKGGGTKEIQVFDYYAHGDLYNHIFKKGNSGSEEILKQLASGIAALHAKGIAHRDIKEENMFGLDPEHWFVGDLGSAIDEKSSDRRRIKPMTTMQRAAPEVAKALHEHYLESSSPEVPELRDIDPMKADSWSFGVMALKVLSKKELPWDDRDPQKIAENISRLTQEEIDHYVDSTIGDNKWVKSFLQINPDKRAVL